MSLFEHVPGHIHLIPGPGAIFATGGAVLTAASADERVTIGYIVGVVGLALYHGSRALTAWIDGKRESRDLKRQVADRERQVADRDHTIRELRSDMRDLKTHHATQIQMVLSVALTGKVADLAAAAAHQAVGDAHDQQQHCREAENSIPITPSI